MKTSLILSKKGPNVATIQPGRTIKEAIGVLAMHNIGSLVVVDDNRHPVGILEEHDIIRRAASDEAVFERLVSDVTKKDMVIGSPHDDLRMLAHTMTETRTRHVPLLAEGALVGIVSIADILKAERDTYMGEIDRLQIEILGS